MSRTKAPSTPQAPRRPAQDPKANGQARRPVVPRTDVARQALLPPEVKAASKRIRRQERQAAVRKRREGKKGQKSRRETTEGTSLRDMVGVQPGGPAGQKLATQVANDTDRRYRAFQLKLAGATYDAIGKALGVTGTTAHYDVHQVLREYGEQLQAMAGDAKALAIAETYKVQLAMAVPTEKGDARAAKVFLQCVDIRAKLMGTYAPVKVAPTDPAGSRPYAQAAMDALRAEVAGFFGIALPQPGQALPAPATRIPVYDPALDGPDEPGPAIDTRAVQPGTTNGHHAPAAGQAPGEDDDYQGEGGS